MTNKTNTGAVSVKKENSVVAASFLEEDAYKGLEGLTQEDLATPRIKILQKTSDETNEDPSLVGKMINTVSNETYKSIKVLPCAYTRQYVEWQDIGEGSGAPVNIYESSSDILTKTTRDNQNKDRLENGNYIETCANHFVLVVGEKGEMSPAVMILKSTQLKISRKWNSLMSGLTLQGKNGPYTPPSYSRFYEISTFMDKNKKGQTWYNYEVALGDWVTENDKAAYLRAKEFSQSVKSGKETVKHEQDESKAKDEVPF